MVTGQRRIIYEENSFVEKVWQLIGQDDFFGLRFELLDYQNTFTEAENSLIAASKKYAANFEDEEEVVKQSLSNYAEHYINLYPSVHTLRVAYFITVHSAFEKTWKDLIELYNSYNKETEFGNINYNYFDRFEKPEHKNYRQKIYIDFVVEKYKLLFEYNYIRNAFYHGKNKKNESIDITQFNNLKYLNTDNSSFLISSLQFVHNYSDLIIAFLTEIESEAYKNSAS